MSDATEAVLREDGSSGGGAGVGDGDGDGVGAGVGAGAGAGGVMTTPGTTVPGVAVVTACVRFSPVKPLTTLLKLPELTP
ncbi:MAG: hypothetical protein EBV34_22460 [Betaproteobacteria bacterium]|nr:hypothetical protein [Betaproteobacteria bacterium]